MYCSNCGKSISDEEFQRNGAFCDNCAGNIETPEETPKADEPMETPPKISPVTPQQRIVADGPGRYSKKCLILALFSIAFVITGLILGNMGRQYYYYYYMPSDVRMLINSSTVTTIHIIGLILGISAKKNRDRAEMNEPGNAVRTVGRVFGLNGIIFNSILMALAIVFLIIAIIMIIPPIPFY